jgi:nucleotide-binding universal stress UspA family protein
MSRPILVGSAPESDDRGTVRFAEEVARVTGAPVVEHDTHEIASAIGEQRPALVVLDASGRSAERVIHGASCPVAVVPRGHEPSGVRTVGAAFAPTPEGREALRAAAALARAFGARLRVVTALDPKHAEESEGLLAGRHHDHNVADDIATRHTMEAEDTLQGAVAELAADVDVETDELFQEPAHALVAASANLDLLVMGSRGRGPIKAIVLGSVSRRVTAEAECPVLVLPRGTEGAVEALLATAESQ